MTLDATPEFDLDAYLARIGYVGERQPSRAVLASLHMAHVTHISFENLDLYLGNPIQLDLPSLQAKLVRDCRGGNCHEQTTLFATALEHLGFPVTRLAARIRLGTASNRPRRHMLLRIHVDESDWLADVGFGWNGLVFPIPLEADHETEHFDQRHRLIQCDAIWVQQTLVQNDWQDMYEFDLEPFDPIDFQKMCEVGPDPVTSPLMKGITAQRVTDRGRYTLKDRELIVRLGGQEVSRRQLADDEQLLQELSATFGLNFPPGTRFSQSPIQVRSATRSPLE